MGVIRVEDRSLGLAGAVLNNKEALCGLREEVNYIS